MTQKTKTTLCWLPTILLSLQLATGAFLKLSANTSIVEKFSAMGLQHYLNVFAVAELFFLFLFAWKKTFRAGFFLLVAYFGGATAIEMVHGNPVAPILVLSFLVFAAFLREPSIFNYRKTMRLAA